MIHSPHWYDPLLDHGFRLAASGLLPASRFRGPVPDEASRKTSPEFPTLEIVSHCWQYAHMLAYQLSSLVLHPPTRLEAIVTVYYAEEDIATRDLLDFIGGHEVPHIRWNWQTLPKEQLFRRAIGRNRSALTTPADWIWMTDCDIVFHEGCLDSLADRLQGRRDILVYPRQTGATPLLPASSPMLQQGRQRRLMDIEAGEFHPRNQDRAKGPFQIIHGDVARAVGYCDGIRLYQTPAKHWCKCREDRVFRWLVGTRGTPVDIENAYQIRHLEKGRYTRDSIWSHIRGNIRRMQE